MKKNSNLSVGQAFTKAIMFMNSGRFAEAKQISEEIKRVRPLSPDVHNLLGGIAFKMGVTAEAANHFSRVVELKPDHNEARHNLAKMLCKLARWDEAATHFAILTDTAGNDVDILMNCARAQVKSKKYNDAISTYKKALEVHPSADAVQTELAEAFLKKGDIRRAEETYTTVLARTPAYAPALINLSVTRDIQGRMDEALDLLKEATRKNPNNATAHTHLALALLAREQLTEGWAEYIWRFRQTDTSTLHDRFDVPFWEGEPLKNRRLLIWTEQGPGDEILICSMVPDVIRRGAKCSIVCTGRLTTLLKRSFPNVDIIPREHVVAGKVKIPHVDFQASLSHLGRCLRPSIDAFPSKDSYLQADPNLVKQLRTSYQAGTGYPLIGISWRSANAKAEVEKSTSLQDWLGLLAIPHLRFVSLQYGVFSEEIKTIKESTGTEIIFDSSIDPLIDLDKFAAQVMAMDLIISVSNTTVHVAGGLGRPVWTLVPASVGRIWYWLLERPNSPWYSSMRLFRRSRESNWNPVISQVIQALIGWRQSQR